MHGEPAAHPHVGAQPEHADVGLLELCCGRADAHRATTRARRRCTGRRRSPARPDDDAPRRRRRPNDVDNQLRRSTACSATASRARVRPERARHARPPAARRGGRPDDARRARLPAVRFAEPRRRRRPAAVEAARAAAPDTAAPERRARRARGARATQSALCPYYARPKDKAGGGGGRRCGRRLPRARASTSGTFLRSVVLLLMWWRSEACRLPFLADDVLQRSSSSRAPTTASPPVARPLPRDQPLRALAGVAPPRRRRARRGAGAAERGVRGGARRSARQRRPAALQRRGRRRRRRRARAASEAPPHLEEFMERAKRDERPLPTSRTRRAQ